MEFKCQKQAIDELKLLSKIRQHSIVIEGFKGSGKTYLAKMYCNMIGSNNFVVVPSNVNDIRQSIIKCFDIQSDVVICIENLDSGVLNASYALLKFLEEPSNNIFIIITCNNTNKVPDTILSRSTVVRINPPTSEDLSLFLQSYPEDKQDLLIDRSDIWLTIRNFVDINYYMNLKKLDYLDYFKTLLKSLTSNKPILDIVWSLNHYPDNVEIPISFVLKYIISNTSDDKIRRKGISCMNELDNFRIASHAILSKFVFDCKYGD